MPRSDLHEVDGSAGLRELVQERRDLLLEARFDGSGTVVLVKPCPVLLLIEAEVVQVGDLSSGRDASANATAPRDIQSVGTTHHEIELLDIASPWQCRLLHALEGNAGSPVLLLDLCLARALEDVFAPRTSSGRELVVPLDRFWLASQEAAEERDVVTLNAVADEQDCAVPHPLEPRKICIAEVRHVVRGGCASSRGKRALLSGARRGCRAPDIVGRLGVVDLKVALSRIRVACGAAGEQAGF